MKPTSQKALLGIVFLASISIGLFVLPRRTNQLEARSFDHQGWISVEKANWHPRHLMVADLLKRYPLVGLSRGEILSLLGAPDNAQDASEIEYGLIFEYGHGIEPKRIEHLVLQFNASNQVISVRYKKWRV